MVSSFKQSQLSRQHPSTSFWHASQLIYMSCEHEMTCIVWCRYNRYVIHTFNVFVVSRNLNCRGFFFQAARTKSSQAGCNLQNMLVSDSVQPWICTFLCSNFFYVPWNLIWNHVITPMYSKNNTFTCFSRKAKQPKAFVLCRHVGNRT